MRTGFMVSILLAPMMLQADPLEKFAAARKNAQPLGGLNAFLRRYVGECGSDAFEGAECQRKTVAFRKESTGESYHTQVAEDVALVSVGRSLGDEVDLLVTPIFSAGNLALTQGSPNKTDSQGNPVVPYIVVKAKMPEDIDASTLNRIANMRGLRIELIFTPQGTWTLPRKGGGTMQGVRAKIQAMSISIARSGTELAAWVAK